MACSSATASRLVCDVTEIKPTAGDLDRLERGLASLAAKDFETRKGLGQWAERRANDFKDSALRDRARAIEGDALRIESEMKRLGVDAPREWLAMAQDARQRQVPEPEPSALGHRALQAKLAAATTDADVTAVIKEINEFFPERRQAIARRAGSTWRVGTARTPTIPPAPIATHRPPVRKALDRRHLGRRHRATPRSASFGQICNRPSPRRNRPRRPFPEKPTLPAAVDRQGGGDRPPRPGQPAAQRGQGTGRGLSRQAATAGSSASKSCATGSRSSETA